jgi:hypothetical protein
MPTLQLYWESPPYRMKGDRGNVSSIRSPVRASILPDCASRGGGRRAGWTVGSGDLTMPAPDRSPAIIAAGRTAPMVRDTTACPA